MFDKIRRGIKKIKNKLIVGAILWVIITIVFVSPLSIAIHDISLNPNEDGFVVFIESTGEHLGKPFSNLGLIFSKEYIGSFFSTVWKFTILYIIVAAVGIAKAMPKHEYDDIEHGSSDWSENGEQYKVLSKNKGILLAEKHYLPLNKRGNINVLVVGRFWITENQLHMLYQMHINS